MNNLNHLFTAKKTTLEDVLKSLSTVNSFTHMANKNIGDCLLQMFYINSFLEKNSYTQIIYNHQYEKEFKEIEIKLSKHPEITNLPDNITETIHGLINEGFLTTFSSNSTLKNAIELNLHQYYGKYVLSSDNKDIDLNMMKHLYFYYQNSGGVGKKIGNPKIQKKVLEALEFYKTHRKEDIEEMLTLDTEISNGKLTINVIMGLLEDFSDTQYSHKLFDTFLKVDLGRYALENLLSNPSTFNNLSNYIVEYYEKNSNFHTQHLLSTFLIYSEFKDYFSPTIIEKVNNVFDRVIDILAEKKQPNIAISQLVLLHAIKKSFSHFIAIHNNYSMDNKHHHYYEDETRDPTKVFLERLPKNNFDFFDTIHIFDIVKDNLKNTQNGHTYSYPAYIFQFLKIENPTIKEFEQLFECLLDFKNSSHKFKEDSELDYHNFGYSHSNNIFSFISEYIRSEPIEIRDYFSNFLRDALDGNVDNKNNLSIKLKEELHLLNSNKLIQARADVIALENNILDNIIVCNDAKSVKIKF